MVPDLDSSHHPASRCNVAQTPQPWNIFPKQRRGEVWRDDCLDEREEIELFWTGAPKLWTVPSKNVSLMDEIIRLSYCVPWLDYMYHESMKVEKTERKDMDDGLFFVLFLCSVKRPLVFSNRKCAAHAMIWSTFVRCKALTWSSSAEYSRPIWRWGFHKNSHRFSVDLFKEVRRAGCQDGSF